MKAFLMYEDRDFELKRKLPSNEQALTQDLELNTLFNTMAAGDKFLFDVVRKAIFLGLSNDLYTILYRQSILKDCLRNPSVVREIYDLLVQTIKDRKRRWYSCFSEYPSSVLHSSIELMQLFSDLLRKLRKIAEEHAGKFESKAFTAFFGMLKEELDEEYLGNVRDHLRQLKFRNGVLVSAQLGKGNEGVNYVLRKPRCEKWSRIKRIFTKRSPVYTYSLHSRDEAGSRFLSELRDRGINLVANALGQSSDHILSFISMLRVELAFYIGCLNLYDQLVQEGQPLCFPLPAASAERRHSFKGLYDVCLALTMKQKITGNDVNADQKDLVIITGANQGGKSTFLRSIGLAQLMMQAGMFVAAESFCSNIFDGLFTHYKREEDVTMNSGKLDEELSRMSDIVEHVTSNPLLLFNESFAATNEREGSEIARQIVCALLEKGIKVFFVSHQYEFAYGFYTQKRKNAIFLRAERRDDGERTFKLLEGEPLQTSYAEDLYREIWPAGI